MYINNRRRAAEGALRSRARRDTIGMCVYIYIYIYT